jgi:hypothetical protein
VTQKEIRALCIFTEIAMANALTEDMMKYVPSDG